MLDNISFVSENNFWPYITFNVLVQRFDFVHLLADYFSNRNSDSDGNALISNTTYKAADATYTRNIDNSNARQGFNWLIKLESIITPDNKNKLTSIYHYYQDNLTATNLFLDPLTQYAFAATGSLNGTLFSDFASGVKAILEDERGDDSTKKPSFLNSV